jgi:hypothetical protein
VSDAYVRVAAVIGAVAAAALRDRRLARIALLDDGGPEAELAARILGGAVGTGAVHRVTDGGGGPDARTREEGRRYHARLLEGALTAHPASKTVLLLSGELPPEPLLPLGDLWATDVEALCGAWSAPEPLRLLAATAGGIGALDAALRRRFDERDPDALSVLPPTVRADVEDRLAAGAPSRRWARLVPKLGVRTLAADLFE